MGNKVHPPVIPWPPLLKAVEPSPVAGHVFGYLSNLCLSHAGASGRGLHQREGLKLSVEALGKRRGIWVGSGKDGVVSG